MFSRISGRIVDRAPGLATVEAGGLGYDIFLPACLESAIGSVGDAATLEIYPHLVIEGNSGRFTFFGFTNAIEREFFEALLTVASIGPRTAARAFALPMGRIAEAIERGDTGALVRLPGIGQQKAREIVAKLQGRVTKFLLIREGPAKLPAPERPGFADEALLVLLQLEYRRPEAEAMIEAALRDHPAFVTTEALLAAVYRTLHARGRDDTAAPAAVQRKRTRTPNSEPHG